MNLYCNDLGYEDEGQEHCCGKHDSSREQNLRHNNVGIQCKTDDH